MTLAFMGSGGKDISWLGLVVIGVGGAICLGIGVIIRHYHDLIWR
jgi:hypothetical protein